MKIRAVNKEQVREPAPKHSGKYAPLKEALGAFDWKSGKGLWITMESEHYLARGQEARNLRSAIYSWASANKISVRTAVVRDHETGVFVVQVTAK